LLIAGCEQPPVIDPNLMPEPVEAERDEPPAYAELIKRYNQQVEPLDRIWAATDVRMEWENADGDRRSERGDGNLIMERPGRVALTVGKLGETVLWAGASDDGYWLFDLQDRGTVYYGRYRYLNEPCSRALPMPIQPEAVPYLLGTMPLDPEAVPAGPVEQYNGYYLIEPPELNVRMLLHPDSARPVRIDLLDETGRSVVIARLRDPQPVKMKSVAEQKWPAMASEAEVYVLEENARLELELNQLAGGPREDRIKAGAFDFDTLMTVHEPARRVDLDRDCPGGGSGGLKRGPIEETEAAPGPRGYMPGGE
jgi:hypothetical protein